MHNTVNKAFALALVAVVILLGLVVGARAAEPASRKDRAVEGNAVLSIQVNGIRRQYVVHVPQNHVRNKSMPVVIVFHGGGGTARNAMRSTGWTGKADQEGFLVVFPEGTRPNPSMPPSFLRNPQTWNDGSNRPAVGAVRRQADDIGFVNALIDDLIGRYSVDQHRIYSTGFSNGASMAFRVGRELSRRIAAIAPVAGSDWLDKPVIREPVSLLYVTGTADPLNPIEGGEIRLGLRSMGNKPPVHEFIQKWVEMLGCSQDPKVIFDRDGVKGSAYGRCKDGAEVILYTIDEMGHVWPGGRSHLPERIVGRRSDKINANDVIWGFFRDHRKR